MIAKDAVETGPQIATLLNHDEPRQVAGAPYRNVHRTERSRPDGSALFEALKIDRASGQLELPQPTILAGLNAVPSPPPSGNAAVYARNRAGAPWIDVIRPSGRDFPLQPHFGVNRIASWSPSVTTTITTEGPPITSDGTVSTPTLTDMGASFAISKGGVLTIFIAAPPNGSSIWVRVVDAVSGAVSEQEVRRPSPQRPSFCLQGFT